MRTTIDKALTAAAFAGLAALGAAMLDGHLTMAEATVAAGMALASGAGTYRVPYFRRRRAEIRPRRRRG